MSETIEKENTEEQKKPSVLTKIFNVLFYTLISIVIVVALLYTVVNLSGSNGVSTILGFTV